MLVCPFCCYSSLRKLPEDYGMVERNRRKDHEHYTLSLLTEWDEYQKARSKHLPMTGRHHLHFPPTYYSRKHKNPGQSPSSYLTKTTTATTMRLSREGANKTTAKRKQMTAPAPPPPLLLPLCLTCSRLPETTLIPGGTGADEGYDQGNDPAHQSPFCISQVILLYSWVAN